MKTKNLLVLIAFLFSGINGWSQGTTWANQINPITVTSNTCGNNCFEYTVSNIPQNLVAGQDKGYHYAWIFEDGRVEMGEVLTTTDPWSLTLTHTYESSGIKAAQLQLTRRYKDTDKPKKMVAPDVNVPGTFNNSIPGGREQLRIDSTLLPTGGDTLFYILNYHNDCESEDPAGSPTGAPISGSIEFTIDDPNQATIISAIFNGETNQSILNDKVSFEFANLEIGTNRNVFFEIAFSDDLDSESEHEVGLSAKMIIDSGVDSSCFQPGSEVLDSNSFMVVKSHDPNKIIAEYDSMCPIPDDNLMTYTIIFQNIGPGKAHTVKVIDILPKYFELISPANVIMIDPKVPPSINYSTRELTWVLTRHDSLKNGNYLRGTGETDFINEIISEEETMDTISFEVRFDPDVPLPPCGAIINRAEIFFDNNPSIFTNDFITGVECDNCDTCYSNPNITTLPPQFYNGYDSAYLQLPAHHNANYTWYPALGLNLDSLSNPNAGPDDDMLYTVIVTSDCTRKIYHLPVMTSAEKCDLTVEEIYNCCSCKIKINASSGSPPYLYNWSVVNNGKMESRHGSELNLRGITDATVTVSDSLGQKVIFSPRINCWKNYILHGICATILFIFLCLSCFYIFNGKKSKRKHKKHHS